MKKTFSIICISISVILGILCWLLLPDTVVVQINTQGQPSNTLPKFVSILIGLAITFAGSLMHLKCSTENRVKSVILSVAGIIILLATLLFNL